MVITSSLRKIAIAIAIAIDIVIVITITIVAFVMVITKLKIVVVEEVGMFCMSLVLIDYFVVAIVKDC
jgi:hypothetical protein